VVRERILDRSLVGLRSKNRGEVRGRTNVGVWARARRFRLERALIWFANWSKIPGKGSCFYVLLIVYTLLCLVRS